MRIMILSLYLTFICIKGLSCTCDLWLMITRLILWLMNWWWWTHTPLMLDSLGLTLPWCCVSNHQAANETWIQTIQHLTKLLLRWRSLQRVLGRKRLRIWLRSRCYGRLVPGQRWRMETRSSLCPGRETAGFLIRILVTIGAKICRLSCRVLKASALLKTSLKLLKNADVFRILYQWV